MENLIYGVIILLIFISIKQNHISKAIEQIINKMTSTDDAKQKLEKSLHKLTLQLDQISEDVKFIRNKMKSTDDKSDAAIAYTLDTQKDKLLYDVAKEGLNKPITNSYIQRTFSLGFMHANRIIQQLQDLGICSIGTKQLKILLSAEELDQFKKEGKFK